MRCAQWLLVGVVVNAFACQDQRFGTDPSKADALWVAPGPAHGQPAVDVSTVYFGTTDHRLLAVDRETGTIRWQARTDSVSVRTEFGDNVVLSLGSAIFGDYFIYAFDQATGTKRWVFNPERQGIPGYAAGAYELASDDGIIYAGSGSGHVYAVDARNGSLVWFAALAADGNSSAFDPVVGDETLFVTVRHFTNPITGALFALDRQTGAVRWSHTFVPLTPQMGSGPLGKVVLFGNLVIAAIDDGRIHALDAASGDERWVAPRLAGVLGLDDSRPLVLAGAVLVAGSDALELTGYEASTGSELWQVNAHQGSSGNPLATDGTVVYVPFDNGVLGAFHAHDGSQIWLRSAPSNGHFTTHPFAATDAIFAPSSVGLVALTK